MAAFLHTKNNKNNDNNNNDDDDDDNDNNADDNNTTTTNNNNINRYRKSFHATPPGFAIIVQSPATFSLQPMMINTRNPAGTGSTGGPLPSSSTAPPGAEYSGA
jgi:hypothetical protein